MFINLPLAPSIYASSFNLDEYTGPMRHGDGPPMTRLQILMQREIGTWPVYTVIIAFGQVCYAYIGLLGSSRSCMILPVDAECNKFPDHTAFWTELARAVAGVCPWWYLLDRFGDLVCDIQTETISLDPIGSVVLLCGSILPHRIALCIEYL